MIDVTDKVEIGDIDGESLSFIKCVCGKRFDYWDFIINICQDIEVASACPNCGRKFCFRAKVTVYCINEDEIK